MKVFSILQKVTHHLFSIHYPNQPKYLSLLNVTCEAFLGIHVFLSLIHRDQCNWKVGSPCFCLTIYALRFIHMRCFYIWNMHIFTFIHFIPYKGYNEQTFYNDQSMTKPLHSFVFPVESHHQFSDVEAKTSEIRKASDKPVIPIPASVDKLCGKLCKLAHNAIKTKLCS